jgi:putative nucleotidyltransferase with HDIG domain
MNETLMVQNERRRDEMANLPWAHLRIPPFPQVAIKVLQMANDENVQLHQLSDLISSDPAFASEVLTVANSLLYAPRFPSSSILQAIAVLGANNLQGLCLTVGARAYLGKSISVPAMKAIWRHNMACALIAEQLAAAGFIDKDFAYTCGVLHDIGRLALAIVRPKEYALLLGVHSGPPQSILKAEQDMFGWDHCEMGRHLVQDWKLPCDFEAIVAEHHSPRKKDDSWGMSELINLSCRMADTAGFASFSGCETTPFPELLDELPARERRQFHPELEVLTAEITHRIGAVETA